MTQLNILAIKDVSPDPEGVRVALSVSVGNNPLTVDLIRNHAGEIYIPLSRQTGTPGQARLYELLAGEMEIPVEAGDDGDDVRDYPQFQSWFEVFEERLIGAALLASNIEAPASGAGTPEEAAAPSFGL